MHRLLLLLVLASTGCAQMMEQERRVSNLATPTPVAPATPPAPPANATPTFRQEGVASWYGGKFAGRLTANGERYDPAGITAAHKTLPFGTWVLVTDLKSGHQVRVRINDRFPGTKGRIIDLSEGAFSRLAPTSVGILRVRLEASP